MGETENAGFNAKVQRNPGLDFATTAQIIQKHQPGYSLV